MAFTESRRAILSSLLFLAAFIYLTNNELRLSTGVSIISSRTTLVSNRTSFSRMGPLLDRCGSPVTVSNKKFEQDVIGRQGIMGTNNNISTTNTTTNMETTKKELYYYCSAEHERAVKFCSNNDNNKVLLNEYANYPPRIKSWSDLRPYSISPILPTEDDTALLPRCRTLKEYLAAIKLGTRQPSSSSFTSLLENSIKSDDSLPIKYNVTETEPSIFIPHNCHVPFLPPSPSKTCSLLNQYTHVIFHGDSLTRHLRMAMYMAMSGDYVRGGVMTLDSTVLNECKCDGSFGERKVCRKVDGYYEQTIMPKEIPAKENVDDGGGGGGETELCPNATFYFGKVGMSPWLSRKNPPQIDPGGNVDWNAVDCTKKEYKGILLVLQGGLHYMSNYSETFQAVVQPVITHPKFHECECLGKIRLIWLSMSSMSTVLGAQYPHQSRPNAILFNDGIKHLFQSAGFHPGEDVLILDWWNFTKEAQSSDGVHYLADVNLGKAAQILYLVENWPFPKRYYNASECLKHRYNNDDE